MKRTFRMENLDCANCAAKMENAIKQLSGVNDAGISFMTQKLTLDAEDDMFESVLEEAKRVCRSIEPDCAILA